MKKQTAVGWLETKIVKFHNWKQNPIYDENCFDEIELNKAIQQAKELEKQQAHEYAEFAIRCDRKEMKILNFDGFINLE